MIKKIDENVDGYEKQLRSKYMKLMNYSFKLKKNHLIKKNLIREKTLSNESYLIVLLSSEKNFLP